LNDWAIVCDELEKVLTGNLQNVRYCPRIFQVRLRNTTKNLMKIAVLVERFECKPDVMLF
jgi:hypothetical protein